MIIGKKVSSYKIGDWKSAVQCFEVFQSIDPNDGPSKTLISYIKNRNCTDPEGWNGIEN